MGAFLPYIGYLYWKRVGLVSGLIASAIFLNKYALMLPRDIMTEPFIVFMIFLTIVYTIVWQKNKTWYHALVLGIIMSYDLLVKGSLIYVPVMYLGYFLILWRKKTVPLSQMVWLFLGICSIAVLWSVYGSLKLGKPVLLTTQDSLIVTMGNNERSMSGEPYMVLPTDDSYYNKLEVMKMPLYLRVVTFYLNHREMIPGIFINKIRVAFENLAYFKILIFMLIIEVWWRMFPLEKKRLIRWLFTLMLPAVFLYVCLELSSPVFMASSRVAFLIGLINTPRLLSILLVSVFLFYRKRGYVFDFPFPMAVFIINFILITLITFGFSRYVEVIAFITILSGINYLLQFLIRFYRIISIGVGRIKESG